MCEIFQNNAESFFKHSVLTNQYLNRVLAFMISAEYHTPKHEEKIKELQRKKVSRMFKNGIFQEISKADHFSFISNENCMFSYCRAFCHVSMHRLTSNLYFEISSISPLPLSEHKVRTLVKIQWQENFAEWNEYVNRGQWPNFTVRHFSKIISASDSHFGVLASIK